MDMLSFRSASAVEALMSTCAMNHLMVRIASHPADALALGRCRETYDALKQQARNALSLDQVRRLILVCQAAIDGHLDAGSQLEVDSSSLTDAVEAIDRLLSAEAEAFVAPVRPRLAVRGTEVVGVGA